LKPATACAILTGMSTATISGRIDRNIDSLLAKQAAGMKRSQLVSRDVTEKVLERAYPGIGFRDGVAGREAYMLGHRVAVWEVERVFRENRSIAKTAVHFDWPVALVKRAMAYAQAFPKEIQRCRVAETT
jgi:hypothetical protein